MNPHTTTCRRNRTDNLPTDRLKARRAHLSILLRHHSRTIASRHEYATRVAELVCIERTLVLRGDLRPDQRLTRGD